MTCDTCAEWQQTVANEHARLVEWRDEAISLKKRIVELEAKNAEQKDVYDKAAAYERKRAEKAEAVRDAANQQLREAEAAWKKEREEYRKRIESLEASESTASSHCYAAEQEMLRMEKRIAELEANQIDRVKANVMKQVEADCELAETMTQTHTERVKELENALSTEKEVARLDHERAERFAKRQGRDCSIEGAHRGVGGASC